jgi:hypothetical protein
MSRTSRIARRHATLTWLREWRLPGPERAAARSARAVKPDAPRAHKPVPRGPARGQAWRSAFHVIFEGLGARGERTAAFACRLRPARARVPLCARCSRRVGVRYLIAVSGPLA